MIKDNIIYFGYGSIVTSCQPVGLQFIEIDPVVIGKTFTPSEFKKNYIAKQKVVIDSTYNNIQKLISDLKIVKEMTNKQIQFEGYVLDFNQYNMISVCSVSHFAAESLHYLIRAMCC